FAAVVVLKKRDIGKELAPYASSIIMLTEAFFLVLLLFVANPFHQLGFVPADGRGLNPLLENPGMFFHPPFLLAGYVGFTVPFAFAIAALLTNRLRDDWI
ncbi:MAG: heme lyase CcmF/NrfE family subunit, partial [Armatimonadetes bacterium]|nr:heme lyase CcmF/NrfE family subunit [Armatimonadota bacterium]NIO98894.1 heme lyase CcmF/NrfE family subunit [Armatimonadota bacterium]